MQMQQQQEMQMAAQAAQAAPGMASAVKDLSETQTGQGGTALDNLASEMGMEGAEQM
jgi:hypothetical protein